MTLSLFVFVDITMYPCCCGQAMIYRQMPLPPSLAEILQTICAVRYT